MIRARSETRMPCAEMVRIQWKDKGGKMRKGSAILEDISSSGACLQLEGPVPAETQLQVRHRKGLLKGTVRYCVFRDIGYFVGLQFEEESRWSPRNFQPEHYLDLRRLLSRAIRSATREEARSAKDTKKKRA